MLLAKPIHFHMICHGCIIDGKRQKTHLEKCCLHAHRPEIKAETTHILNSDCNLFSKQMIQHSMVQAEEREELIWSLVNKTS